MMMMKTKEMPMTAPLTMTEARAAIRAIPVQYLNNNCVQDAAARLRAAMDLASGEPNRVDAPSYVVKAVNDLASWLRPQR
jgi:hypothetical protein